MHYLVWNDEKFEVDQGAPSLDLREEVGDHIFPWVRHSQGQVNQHTWTNFLEKKQADNEVMDLLLTESWRRCADMGVDPSPRKCWDFLDQGALAESAGRLKELTAPLEPQLYKLMGDMGLIVNIVNSDSYVVHTYGHPEILHHSNNINFGPGANWSEASVGTNAIGTSLITGRAVQIFDQEHFCRSHHDWRCTAAPFYDPHGEVVGCFDISGPSGSDHTKALNLVLWAARSIEHRLLRDHAQDLSTWPMTLLGAMPPGLTVGFVVLDRWGQVLGASEAALAMLGCGLSRLAGKNGEDLFDLKAFFQNLRSGRGDLRTPVRCRLQTGLTATAQGLKSSSGYWLGTLISLLEPSSARSRGIRPGLPEKSGSTASQRERRFISHSPQSEEILALVRGFAKTSSTVLISGESGTGKELVARMLHREGPRSGGPFVAVNCGALSRELIQSELFGYVGGSFTGADRAGRAGLFEQADGGVIFLDEITEMPLELQANLLRVLEEKTVARVGGGAPVALNLKVVAATNRDLAAEAAEGRFRADLYYRLNVAAIHLPPLRERPEDVIPLAEYHFQRLAGEMGLEPPPVSEEVFRIFQAHDWPGNVRALANAAEYALNRFWVQPAAEIGPQHLPPLLSRAPADRAGGSPARSLKDAELQTIQDTIQNCGGNLSRAAGVLGISRSTLYAKLARLSK